MQQPSWLKCSSLSIYLHSLGIEVRGITNEDNTEKFNIELCIFCQKGDDLKSTESRRSVIRASSLIRDDYISSLLNTSLLQKIY